MQLPKFYPRLIEDLRGYTATKLSTDIGAGITVGIVALPLAMAFAIASGLPPQVGLWTAIIGGFFISLLGGASVSIGGPAGAYIVVVYAIVKEFGATQLLVCTAISGVFIFLIGMFQFGRFVRLVPSGIVVGFTNGIAVLIALSQIKEMTVSVASAAVAATSVLLIFAWAKYAGRLSAKLARIPAPIVALLMLSVAAWYWQIPVETIGSRFGEISANWPAFQLPHLDWLNLQTLFVPIVTLTFLGVFESLLCARIADQVGGGAGRNFPDHDPNQELMGQGIANAALACVGGMPATGTIARTLTNIKCGATTPVAGLVHALTLLCIVMLGASFAAHVPLAALAGLLLFIAWNMGEWRELIHLHQRPWFDQVVMWTTFILTVTVNLLVALAVSLSLVLLRRQVGKAR